MYPEDRVLVGVINRKRDLKAAQVAHWYRIPRARMPRGVYAEYLAFFLSSAFGPRNGGVHYYAPFAGLELAYRKDLLPDEPNHRHANEVYYRVALDELVEKKPPILNPTRRTITFVVTTWDRFVHARTIAELYSTNDYFVDRIYHALRDSGYQPLRSWDAERKVTGHGAQLHILCERGLLVASPDRADDGLYLDDAQSDDAILTTIRAAIAREGGPVTISVPLEGL